MGGVLNLDTDLKLTFHVANDLNPDQNQRPSPVVVRLYELNSIAAYETADFIDIYERDEELLGKALVGKQVFKPMVPGETRQEDIVLKPGTTHVALYAEFSRYRNSAYKLVFPVTQNNVFRNAAIVRISANHLSLMN